MQDLEKEFKPTSWSVDNKIVVYVATLIICLAGMMTFQSLPKENFPEVIIPTIIVATVYPGAAPEDVENLISKQIEKQVKSITGVDKVTSNSVQDFSSVVIEFDTDIDVKTAKIDVQAAVDKAKPDLPTDLPDDPQVMDIDFSSLPIMNINLSGDFDLKTLKKYADQMQDRIESLPEIRRVDIVGALDREIQVNVDIFKMANAGVSLDDISSAVRYENMIVSGGQLTMGGMKRSLSVNGEFHNADQIKNIVVGATRGGKIYLADVADVVDSHKEQESYSRLDGKNVITLNVVKRSGENLIISSDKINDIVKEFEADILPKGTKVTVTADQSEQTRVTLHDLINTIIIGFILVSLILMFFMGVVNAVFVALSVPLSSFIAFLVFPLLGYTLNMMTLFSFLLALGIVVDDAIVVIENTHRIYANGKVPIRKAAKLAAGEVFMPVLTGTLVVLAPFIPLAFWPGIIGDFMVYLPITLIVALLASLLVAYIINPVFAADFMVKHDHDHSDSKFSREYKRAALVMLGMAALGYLAIGFGFGNFVLLMFLLYTLYHFYLQKIVSHFQTSVWPKLQGGYKNLLAWTIAGKRSWMVLATVIGLFIFSIVFTGIRKPPVVFFPQGDPNFIFTYIRLPIGTAPKYTDSITHLVENRVRKVVGEKNEIVSSVISNVAINATSDFTSVNAQPHLGKVTVAFVEFSKRKGRSSGEYLTKIRNVVKGIPGAEITVEQEKNGPPTGKPINIEVSADNFDVLISTADKMKRYLDSLQIPGIEELKSDMESNKPEIAITINREKANRQGISTGQIGGLLRGAIYGTEASRFRDDNDDYPIQVRVKESQRNNINTLMNIPIIFRDMSTGMVRQVPLASVAGIDYSNSFASIRRIDQRRVVSVSSNVLSGFNENEIVAKIKKELRQFSHPDEVEIKLTGAQEKQEETSSFLGVAFMIAMGLIFMILVAQFNSVSRPIIIMSEIILSVIGILIGFSLFKMEISIVMTGVGLMTLAGIVVRNGILLVEFSDLLMKQGMKLEEAVLEAARTRMTPVLLTAMAATLGLIPLAVGLNIDFIKLFTELNPHIFFGGDNVAFWGPLSWTIIFGLIFGTFLTLFVVPSMYLIAARLKKQIFKKEYVQTVSEN